MSDNNRQASGRQCDDCTRGDTHAFWDPYRIECPDGKTRCQRHYFAWLRSPCEICGRDVRHHRDDKAPGIVDADRQGRWLPCEEAASVPDPDKLASEFKQAEMRLRECFTVEARRHDLLLVQTPLVYGPCDPVDVYLMHDRDGVLGLYDKHHGQARVLTDGMVPGFYEGTNADDVCETWGVTVSGQGLMRPVTADEPIGDTVIRVAMASAALRLRNYSEKLSSSNHPKSSESSGGGR